MTKRIAPLLVLLLTTIAAFGASNPRAIRTQNQFHLPVKGQMQPRLHAQADEMRTRRAAAMTQHSPAARTRAVVGKTHPYLNPPLSQIGFASASLIPAGGQIPSGSNGSLTLAGDFNGDGKLDFMTIVLNTSTYSVSVVLSNGNGTFPAPVLTAVPSNEFDAFAVADLNGDGKDDLVIIHQANGSIAATFDVLLSHGDGTFTLGTNNTISPNLLSGGLLYDVNGDGKMDMVAIDSSNPGNVWTLLGNGDGTFLPASSVALSGVAGANVIFADFNGDGLLDFASNDSSTNKLTVFLATSPALYASGVAYTTSDGIYDACSSASGDLTGDGKPEIVNVNCNDGTITIFVNNGDGSFQQGTYYATGSASTGTAVPYLVPVAVSIADVNGDGLADVIATNAAASDVTVLLGNGDGTVQVPVYGYATGGFTATPALVADFNGDGLADILLTDGVYNFSYMQGYGDGTFRAGLDFYSPLTDNGSPYGYDIATGDFNGDGFPDVVLSNWCCDSTDGITVFLSRGDGSMSPGVNYGTGGYFAYVTVADFNQDGKLDIAAVDNLTGTVQIYTGAGDGSFTTGPSMATNDTDSETIAAGDLNGDGFPDLVVANTNGANIGVILNDGAGGLLAEVPVTLNNASTDVVLADVNGDGKLDLVTPEFCGCIAVLLGDGLGNFGAQQETPVAANPYRVAVGDFNGDGKLDFAVTITGGVSGPQGIQVALGNGDGTFQTPSAVYPASLQNPVPYRPNTSFIQLRDLDGDGKLDMLYTNGNYGTVGVMYGLGDGTFYDPVEFATGQYPQGLALADVNGDGAVDVVTAGDDNSEVTVLLNNSGSKLLADYSVAATPASATVTAGSAGTFVITLSPRNFYNGTVTFSCGTLPAKTTCSFSNPTLSPNGNGALTTTLTLTTTATTTTMGRLTTPFGPATPLLASLTGMGLFGLMLTGKMFTGKMFAGDWRKKGSRRMGILLAVVALGMTCSLAACGGGSPSSNNGGGTTNITVPGTPTGAYTVAVSATGTAGTTKGNSAPHNLNVNLTVQ